MEELRQVVNLIPYVAEDIPKFFLQRRTKDAPVRPGLLGLWGGGKKSGENDDQALLREISSELGGFKLGNYFFLGTYFDGVPTKKNIYCQNVSPNLLENIIIHEGDGGTLLSLSEIENSKEVDEGEKGAFRDLHKKLKSF